LFTNAHAASASDPFAALGLSWGASTAEIKLAFRKLAMRHHPDVGSERDEGKFLKISAAYEALTAKARADGDDAGRDYSWQAWRGAAVIADGRTDVAGAARRRPAPPVGHPTSALLGFAGSKGGGLAGRAELLGEGGRRPSTVGRGGAGSKWVSEEGRRYKPWKGGGEGG
ncbi:hypothetical protein TeGR_g5291, partial [Tetraparma gracilis]